MSSDGSCGRDSCGCESSGASSPFPGGVDPDGDSFHPMGEEWEGEMEKMLDDTEYDTELGMEMAEDAMELVKGELSEEEFYDKYHDAVIDEFGTDERPMAELFEEAEDDDSEGGFVEALRGLGDDDVSRRQAMKKMGFGAAAVGLGSGVGSESGVLEDEQDAAAAGDHHVADGDMQYGMVIDLERCDGCLECVVGCMEENNTSTGANWMYVLTYEDERTDEENFLVRPCQHCTNAPCAKVCPVTARHKRDKDGLVLTDYDICIGCRYCQVACPYGVNYFQWGQPTVPFEDVPDDHTHDERDRWVDSRPPKGVMGKCTFCPSRQDGNHGEEQVGTVACMDACDAAGMSAIHFGDMNDPESRPNQYLERRKEVEERADEKFEDPQEDWEETITGSPKAELSAFKLLEEMGTEPNITYLGNEPGSRAEQTDGPVDYEDKQVDIASEVMDRRKDHLDLGAEANRQVND